MRSSIAADVVVLVFARAPQPGRAKTRLIPALGPWGAAALQKRMTLRTVRMAVGAFPVELHGTAHHAFFRSLNVPFVLQRGADLGERMHRAFARALRRHARVIIIGTDCPVLQRRDLRRAARLLCSNDVVLMPAEDGGYALIGLRRPSAQLFEGIAWGGTGVLRDTLAKRAAEMAKLLRTAWDVDRPEDLPRLRSLRFSSGSRRAARR